MVQSNQSEKIYTQEIIEEVCKEIEKQWGYHVTVRRAFPYRVVAHREIAQWLNQNYVIRLFGILNEHNIITAGREASNPYTRIVALLRQRVGSHSRGRRNLKDKEATKAAHLIQEYLDPRFGPEDLSEFNLSIDTVLRPLKNHCIQFVRPLIGKPIPNKKPSKNGD